jgi:hypothetical protein
MAQPFDLKTFIELQKQYASDLGGIATSSNSDRDAANNAIKTLGDNLDNLDKALNSSNADTNSLLLQQNSVNNILKTENERLDSKKASIDNAITGQKRLMQLNDTYRKRYSAYINLVLIIVLALIIIIVLIFINKVFPFIPEFVYTLLYIIILSGTAIYCWFVINDIQKRDKFDYDKHTRPAPATTEELKKNAEAAAKAGNLLASIDSALGCKSEGCCTVGTKWSAADNKCIPDCGTGKIWDSVNKTCVTTCPTGTRNVNNICVAANAFTTIQQAYSQEPELRKTVEPYTPCEFEGYSKL